jgi:hypothetical protein
MMMMMMIWTKVFTSKINNPLMQKQSPTFMQLAASNPIGGKGWARRSHKAPQCLLRFWLMKSQNHQTWKIVFCRPSTKKGLWTQPPKKENDHARVVCMCVYVFFCVFCTVLKPKPATQKQNLLLKVVEDSCCDVSKKHGWFAFIWAQVQKSILQASLSNFKSL